MYTCMTIDIKFKKKYLSGSFMCIYRSSDIAHKLRIDAVLHITSNAIHVSQKREPNIQYPSRSLKPANVITRHPTNKSAIASDAKNKLPILLNPRSVYIATHTSILPATEKNIRTNRRKPGKKKKKINIDGKKDE